MGILKIYKEQAALLITRKTHGLKVVTPSLELPAKISPENMPTSRTLTEVKEADLSYLNACSFLHIIFFKEATKATQRTEKCWT